MKNSLLIIFCLSVSFFANTQNVKPAKVSIIELIARPNEYQGKLIVVSGFLHYKFENQIIYSSKENADYLMDGIWVNVDTVNLKESIKKFDRHYVRLIGIFDYNSKGHSGCCTGEINLVSSIEKLKRWYK